MNEGAPPLVRLSEWTKLGFPGDKPSYLPDHTSGS